MEVLMWWLIYLALWGVLAYQRASLSVWTIAFGVVLLVQSLLSSVGGGWISWTIFVVVALALNVVPLRRLWLSSKALAIFKKVMPAMSKTEAEALGAGTVGWEGDCFAGKPDWKKLQAIPFAKLTAEEQAFIDGPVEELCGMLSDWDITHKYAGIPKHIMQFIKDNGFFGLIIPKAHGGLGFSAYAHSEVITKLAGVSVTVATTVSVPNSLGPGELILHYGTDEQKSYYLPRLAKGLEIPCFGLTSPTAGSDAAAMTDTGIVCKREIDGKEVLGLLLNWDKRYITLSPIATILGIAFKCYDPDQLLGPKSDIGITCALIPANTPGVTTGRRHYPLNSGFSNGPTQGKDVFIPMEWVIGGQKMLGHGWRMLMECLAAGRGISLPSMVTGGAKVGVLAAGVYSHTRRQFNTAIANFEGVEEALTRISGRAYQMDAMRMLTLSALDQGEKPAVASAIGKYHVTQMARDVVLDGMDVHGGKAICLGPNNYVGRGYQESPVSITVEGANILTRSMIIFGQGAMRCHPYMLGLIEAAKDTDKTRALAQFDRSLLGYLGYLVSNWTRSFILSVTNGFFVREGDAKTRRYYRLMTRYASAFAHVADLSMMLLGGDLKRKEKMSARLGDCLSYLYMGSAILKYFECGGKQADEEAVMAWAMQDVLYRLQSALQGILQNFPNRWVAGYLRAWIFPLGCKDKAPSDRLGRKAAAAITQPSKWRERLAKNAYMTPNDNNLIGQMCHHFVDFLEVEPLEAKLSKAHRKGKIHGYSYEALVSAAVANDVLSQQEADQLLAVNELRLKFNAVDDFDTNELGTQPEVTVTAANSSSARVPCQQDLAD
jgi:acyl-CoA dehydrogenase